MSEQNVRKRVVLTEEQLAPIIDMLQNDKDFIAFKKGALINEFLITIQSSVREYAMRQRQELQALQQAPVPDYAQVDQDIVNSYNQQLSQRMQRRDKSYAPQQTAYPPVNEQPVPIQQQPAQYPQMTRPTMPIPQQMVMPQQPAQTQQFREQVQQQPMRNPEPMPLPQKPAANDDDDGIDFDNFDDSDF